MENISTQLQDFSTTVWQFSNAAFLLAVLSTIVIHAMYDFGLRSKINRKILIDWLSAAIKIKETASKVNTSLSGNSIIEDESQKIEKEIIKLVGTGRKEWFYRLRYQQLCAQISTIYQQEIMKGEKTALYKYLSDHNEIDDGLNIDEIKQYQLVYLERWIDELQANYDYKWSFSNTILSFASSFFIIGFISDLPSLFSQYGFSFEKLTLHFTFFIVVGVLSSFLNKIIDKINL